MIRLIVATLFAFPFLARAECVSVAPVNFAGLPESDLSLSQRFAAADLDHDGRLSFVEAKGDPLFFGSFAALDFNGDGFVSIDEVDAWIVSAARGTANQLMAVLDPMSTGVVEEARLEALVPSLLSIWRVEGSGALTRADIESLLVKVIVGGEVIPGSE